MACTVVACDSLGHDWSQDVHAYVYYPAQGSYSIGLVEDVSTHASVFDDTLGHHDDV